MEKLKLQDFYDWYNINYGGDLAMFRDYKVALQNNGVVKVRGNTFVFEPDNALKYNAFGELTESLSRVQKLHLKEVDDASKYSTVTIATNIEAILSVCDSIKSQMLAISNNISDVSDGSQFAKQTKDKQFLTALKALETDVTNYKGKLEAINNTVSTIQNEVYKLQEMSAKYYEDN